MTHGIMFISTAALEIWVLRRLRFDWFIVDRERRRNE